MSATEPVLLVGFNRPELMAVVVQRLREVQPSRVFIAVDGPRVDRPGEAELVQRCRDLALTVDWPCEVRTLFQDVNLGCGLGVSTAITWFFDHAERGIILEDDIVPDPSFFPFCEELLERYEDDDRVFAISGCNVVPASKITHPQESYRFSRIPTVWGWATWRRSWTKHTLDISNWRERLSPWSLMTRFGSSPSSALSWASEFELTGRGNVDTWDWQLTLAAMSGDQLTATSNTNLVENIGFSADATHTRMSESPLEPPRSIVLPTAPIAVVPDVQADNWATMNHFGSGLLTTMDRWRQYVKAGRPVEARWR